MRADSLYQERSGANKTGGNAGSFFKPLVQPKLTINSPGDAYEQEADAMADKVMRMEIPLSDSAFFKPSIPVIQRKCKECEEEDKMVRRKENRGGEQSSLALSELKGPVGDFNEKELNDAIKTVYGELTFPPHHDTVREARAIASTIFGRFHDINEARSKYQDAHSKVDIARNNRAKAEEEYNQIAVKPSQYKRGLIKQGVAKADVEDAYGTALQSAKDKFTKATKDYAAAQTDSTNAKTELNRVEKGTIPNKKTGKAITLSDIVSQLSQYAGYPKGKSDFKNFSKFPQSSQAQHIVRYNAAVTTVTALAKEPDKADTYRSFKGGNLRPKGAEKGETKIGGNYFRVPDSTVQRKSIWNNLEDNLLHRKEGSGDAVTANSGFERYLHSLNTAGQPLSRESRQFFGPRFGQDFSEVRIHTDTEAAKSAQSINALAYTSGNNIVFNDGQYAPASDSGKRLLAHELTHVVQQSGNRQESILKAGTPSSESSKTGTEQIAAAKKSETMRQPQSDESVLSKIQGYAMPQLLTELCKPEYSTVIQNENAGMKVGGIRLKIAMRAAAAKKVDNKQATATFYEINGETIQSWHKNSDQVAAIHSFLPPIDSCNYSGPSDKSQEIHLKLDPGYRNSAVRVYTGIPGSYTTKEYLNVITGPATLALAKRNGWCHMYPIINKYKGYSPKGLINFAYYSGGIGFHSNYHKNKGKIELIPHDHSAGCARLHDLGPDSIDNGDSKDFHDRVAKGDCVKLLNNEWKEPTFKHCN